MIGVTIISIIGKTTKYFNYNFIVRATKHL